MADLNIGESQQVQFADGRRATVKLLDVAVTHDTVSAAVRAARVTVEVDGARVTLACGNYHLPVTFGRVQIDCSMVKAYNLNTNNDWWAHEKDARLRLWPAGSPLIEPDTFGYFLKQKWLATATQMANEPTYVDGGDRPERKKIYYHNDLDSGGAEGLTEIISATNGLVVSVGGKTLSGYADTPAQPRYDVVYVLDDRGWFYRYSHMDSIDPGVKLGEKIKRGQKIGLLARKEGAAAGPTCTSVSSHGSPRASGARRKRMPTRGRHIVTNIIRPSWPWRARIIS